MCSKLQPEGCRVVRHPSFFKEGDEIWAEGLDAVVFGPGERLHTTMESKDEPDAKLPAAIHVG